MQKSRGSGAVAPSASPASLADFALPNLREDRTDRVPADFAPGNNGKLNELIHCLLLYIFYLHTLFYYMKLIIDYSNISFIKIFIYSFRVVG